MIDWAQFHFLRPLWFTALAPLAVLLWIMVRRKLGSKGWEGICDAALLPYVLISSRTRPDRWPPFLVTLCGVLAILALAGPTWSRLPQPVFSSQSALVIALDLSRSMDAEDIRPSRLARARFKIADLVRQRQEGQTALLVYAGDAFSVTPLTDDGATLLSQLPVLTTDIVPVPGSRADIALERAGELLRRAGRSRGDILLITDEVDAAQAEPEARVLRRDGYRVSVLGVGTGQGVPVPLPDGGFLKNANGELVIPAFDERPMRQIAASGAGIYVRLSLNDTDLEELERLFSIRPGADQVGMTELKTDVWQEQGPWLLLLIYPFAALAFRRGYLVVLLFLLLPAPPPALAFDWEGLWLRPDQQGKHALDAGEAGRAARLFQDPDWKGAAHYRAGEYSAALEALGGADDPERLYNRGNSLARLGRYAEAIAAYEEALKRDSGNADALFNKELLEQELQQPRQQDRESRSAKDGEAQAQQDLPGQGGAGTPDTSDQDSGNSSGGDTRQREEEGAQPPSTQKGAAEQNATGKDAAGDQPPAQPDAVPSQAAREEASRDGSTEAEQGNRQAAAASEWTPPDEERQATEQWLRRIPDDPGGLLRRKFLYQYQQRRGRPQQGEKTW